MKYPSNAASRSGAPVGSPRPANPAPPPPANDNTPKPPKPANDNVKGGRNAVGRYARWLRNPLIQAAAAAALYPAVMGHRVNLDGYVDSLVCTAGGTTLTVPGNCGSFIVNIPWPNSVMTGRPINVSLWQLMQVRPNGLQMVVVHTRRLTRVANESWRRPVQIGTLSPLPAPEYEFPPVPALEPHKVPPLAPAPAPAPVPFPLIPAIPPNPFAPGGTGRTGGYRPPSYPEVPGGWPINPGQDNPDAPPLPANQVPSERWEFNPRGAPRVTSDPHRVEPPGRGEKERKLRATWLDRVMKVVGGVTELNDVVNAFYDALPVAYKIRRRYIREDQWGPYAKDFRTEDGKRLARIKFDRWGNRLYLEPLSPLQKAKVLYKYWDKLDARWFAKAFENLRSNEVEDRLFGTSSQRLNRSLQKSNRYGYRRGRGLQWGLAL